MKYNHWLPKLINANAIVINKKIYFAMSKEKVSDRLLKHEQEHIKQQEEEGFLSFLFNYIKEYLGNRLDGMKHYEAYYNISYEVEARKAEK
mgnify:CR=1 FL=1